MARTRALRRRGFTRTDLTVAVLLVVLGGGVLLASADPITAAANRTRSSNNLKQLALATQSCAETYSGKMPPALGGHFPGNPGTPNNSYGPCLFHLLPYLEYDHVFKSSLVMAGVPTYASWQVAGQTIKVLQGPGDPTADTAPDSTSYLANALAFGQGNVRFPASFADGTSNTILFAEGYARAVYTIAEGGQTRTWAVQRRWWDDPVWFPHTAGVAYQVVPPADAASAALPQGYNPRGIQVALADGSTRTLRGCSAKTFYEACTPNGGEVLGSDWDK
jgi:hypothetical protein